MRKEENNRYIVRDKRLVTNLSIAYEISTATYSSFVKGSKKTKKNKLLFLANN